MLSGQFKNGAQNELQRTVPQLSSEAGPKRVMIVYGTRPEAIKIAPVVEACRNRRSIDIVLVSSGQHRSLLTQVNEVFGLKPDFEMDLFEEGQSLNRLSGRVFAAMDEVLQAATPDAVLVQGDTTTVFSAAMASFNRGTRVVHLEAGLRSGNRSSPFPEEMNRRVVSQIADLHLAPTQTAKNNLLAEGLPVRSITVTGNTVIDALMAASQADTSVDNSVVRWALEGPERFVVVTIHRRENWPFLNQIVSAINRLADRYRHLSFIVPMHANPLVREAFKKGTASASNIQLTESLGYVDFAKLLKSCEFVISDSGGVQEEAPAFGKPVFVVRDNTERPEAVLAGTVRLVGSSESSIFSGVTDVLDSPKLIEGMRRAVNPYGDGMAGDRVLSAIEELLGVGSRDPEFRVGG